MGTSSMATVPAPALVPGQLSGADHCAAPPHWRGHLCGKVIYGTCSPDERVARNPGAALPRGTRPPRVSLRSPGLHATGIYDEKDIYGGDDIYGDVIPGDRAGAGPGPGSMRRQPCAAPPHWRGHLCGKVIYGTCSPDERVARNPGRPCPRDRRPGFRFAHPGRPGFRFAHPGYTRRASMMKRTSMGVTTSMGTSSLATVPAPALVPGQ
jgi:hypothetical protein